MRVKTQHPALSGVFQEIRESSTEDDAATHGVDQTTSLTLARALAVGCLSRLDLDRSALNIWDPAAGSGLAGHMLVTALESAGVRTHYRGQDISEEAVTRCRRRFEGVRNAEVAVANSLESDAFPEFEADLVIVDAPSGMPWRHSKLAVEMRQRAGEYRFGLPSQSDSTWLFISLALEKLRNRSDGGGRVAALVSPGALRSGNSASVRQAIVDAGFLESVTRLPDALAPRTGIPFYLVTFASDAGRGRRDWVQVADLQTEFIAERGRRVMPVGALAELESALRTRKPGPRSRRVAVTSLIRREAKLVRTTRTGSVLSWQLTTHGGTEIDDSLIEERYGPEPQISIESVREILDLDPSHIFGDDTRDLMRDLLSKGWAARRLSGVISTMPAAAGTGNDQPCEGRLYIPTTQIGRVSAEPAGTGEAGRHLVVQLDSDLVEPSFLAAWLNSEAGMASRRRAIEASGSGAFSSTRRSGASALMRWADELILPVPELSEQRTMASADEQMGSFEATLRVQRASIWAAPDTADAVVNGLASAFDDSLTTWLDHLPFPLASALWTAETQDTPGEKRHAYLQAWEAIVTFHATVLLSATRNSPGGSSETEAAIRAVLQEQHLGIERASFGTWVVIVERIAKDVRSALEQNDPDETARMRRSFGDLGRAGIERLVSKDIFNKFNELNSKRNRWLGHAGHTSEQERQTQVASLEADLRELRQLLGNVWSQLTLVRAGSGSRKPDGLRQQAEVAMGTRSPFATNTFAVGDLMLEGELYLVKDGSQSPLRLSQFVQLRTAPETAQYTSYFYNRTEGSSIRMVTYQYSPDAEMREDIDSFRQDLGGLV